LGDSTQAEEKINMGYFKYNGYNVFYKELGRGSPLILLHGNSVSSKLFEQVIELYSEDFKIILIDFLGHGKSDRLGVFPADFWYDEAMQVIRLIEKNQYGKVNLIGTSGGAITALNVALERGDLVHKIIADSFEGEKSLDAIAEYIPEERKESKARSEGRLFWEYCHGSDWESVVDQDTEVCIMHNKAIKNFFHKDLSALSLPVMLTASLEDEFAKISGLDFSRLYPEMASKIADCKICLFRSGGHPAMLTNAVEFSDMAKSFFSSAS
jgi:pimeloyl-ACP methyl ester carboxylesterase